MREGWTYKKLGDCLSYIKNGANIKQTKGANGIPITRIETLSGGVFNRDRLGYANIISAENYSQNILEDGDILMSHINSKAYIGRSVLYKKEDDEQIIHGMNLLRLKVIPSILLPSFLNTSFQSVYFRDEVAKIRKDAVNQSSMAISDLVKIPIPIPPLSEQQRIVSELDLLSAIIEKKKEQLKAYDQLAQSIFYDMFGDPIENPKGWEVKSFGDCFIIGSGGTPSKAIPEYWEEGRIPWIGSNMCQNCIIEKTDGKYITEEGLKHSSAKLLESGTVLVALVGATIGKVALLRTPTAINQNIAYIKVNESKSYLSEYVYYHLMNLYDEFMNIGNGKFKMANQAFIKSLSITCPPLSLQQSFAEKIEAIEKQKALVQQSIIESQTMFDYTMDKYFG